MPLHAPPSYNPRVSVLAVFGTRPEAIKLAPVLARLEQLPAFRLSVLSSGQHTSLLAPFVERFGVRIDHDLQAMRPGQSLNELFARVLSGCDAVLAEVKPDVVLVQGDTTTAAAAAVAAFQRRVPVGHVEAGLRTDDPLSPFPEEMNRRLITRLARWHFAATAGHAANLRGEGVPADDVFVTGNPVVDALHALGDAEPSPNLMKLFDATRGQKVIVLTTHRRESFGGVMQEYLGAVRNFVEAHPDTAVVFPVHPNPAVRAAAGSVLGGAERIVLTDPLDYDDFIGLLSVSWAIASDSGGVQEEAPSLGVPLFILRENTERPEVLDTGLATLCPTAADLAAGLEALRSRTEAGVCDPGSGTGVTDPGYRKAVANPFGDGRAAERIAAALLARLAPTSPAPEVAA